MRMSKKIMITLSIVSILALGGCSGTGQGELQREEEQVPAGEVKVEPFVSPEIANTMQTEAYMNGDGIGTRFEITDGNLYGRGGNTCGQLGLGKTDPEEVNYADPVLIAEHVIHVDSSHGCVIYITEKKELYGLGKSCNGQLGTAVDESRTEGNVSIVTKPLLIADQVAYAEVSAGSTMFLKEDGSLYMLGDNQNGQLGDGTAKPVRARRILTDAVLYTSEPFLVMDNVKFISLGDYTAAAISGPGDLWLWGDNSCGQVGNGRKGNGLPSVSDDVVSSPYLAMKKAKSVSIRGNAVTAVDFSGKEYVWGEGYGAWPKEAESGN